MSSEFYEIASEIEAAAPEEAAPEVTDEQPEEAPGSGPSEETLETAEEPAEEEIPNAAPSGEGGPAEGSRTFKLKVDGEELEVTEEELLRGFQLRKASDKRFQEAADLRKKAEEVINLLKTDPRKALQHPEIGVDTRSLAEEILKEHLDLELMDENERKIHELQQKLKTAEEQKKQEEVDKQRQEAERLEIEYAEQYQKDINSALEGSGLPKTNYTMNRMIHYMQQAIDYGYEASAKDIVELVREDYHSDIKQMFSAADATILARILGEDGLKKVRGVDVQRLKDPKGNPVPGEKQAAAKKRKKGATKTLDDVFAEIRKGIED